MPSTYSNLRKFFIGMLYLLYVGKVTEMPICATSKIETSMRRLLVSYKWAPQRFDPWCFQGFSFTGKIDSLIKLYSKKTKEGFSLNTQRP